MARTTTTEPVETPSVDEPAATTPAPNPETATGHVVEQAGYAGNDVIR